MSKTTEEKAKLYNEALERAKKIHNFSSDIAEIKRMEEIFPELAESEDEKIRKSLFEHFEKYESCTFNGVPSKDIIAWLEKQGEQKPIEPKFKVGDWITNNSKLWKVLEIFPLDYELEDIYGVKADDTISHVDKNFRLWTIEDAKDGDVLVNKNGEMPFIFKECKNNHIYCYCGYTNHKDIFFDRFVDSKGEELHWLNLYYEQVYPATKEQYNLLFAKMNEAGYEWNAVKKGLKKIEQKPIDKVEPKFKDGDWVTNSIETVQITGYDIDYGYQVDYKGNLQHRNTDIIEKEYHLWTIQDVKTGDVLCSEQITLLFKRWEDNSDWNYVIAYVGIDITGKLQITNANERWLISSYAHPAIKEQRDLLFSKMKEAGYEWDAEKKELKKIEQKPINTHKFKVGDIVQYITDTTDRREITNIDESCEMYATSGLSIAFEDEDDWKVVVNAEDVEPEQKPEWTDEDETNLNTATKSCIRAGNYYVVDWLKSLKDRIQPQDHTAKEESLKNSLKETNKLISELLDENEKLDNLCSIIDESSWSDAIKRIYKDWLKSLSPQKQWKPTEEQMDALLFAEGFVRGHCAIEIAKELTSLYEQLKTL